MSTTPVTPEAAVRKLYADFAVALKPARLADSHANGYILAAELKKRGLNLLSATVSDLVSITNEILFQDKLEWAVEPAKLKCQKVNAAPAAVENPLQLEAERTAELKATEAAAAKAKTDAALTKQARELIGGYAPTKTSPREGTIDYTNQDKYQRYWSDLLANVEKGTSVVVADRNHAPGRELGGSVTVGGLQTFVAWLVKDVQHQYALQERLRERM